MSWSEAKSRGDDFYRCGCFDDAIVAYTNALAKDQGMTNISKAIILSNRAQAAAQLREPASAATDCAHALALDPTNAKAAVRRALALEQMGNLSAALEQLSGEHLPGSDRCSLVDCQTLKEAGHLPSSLAKIVAAARIRVRRMLDQDQLLLENCHEQDTLVNEQQTLRLHITSTTRASMPRISLHPSSLATPTNTSTSEWQSLLNSLGIKLSVNIANEFGLWRKRDYAGLLYNENVSSTAEISEEMLSFPLSVTFKPLNNAARQTSSILRLFKMSHFEGELSQCCFESGIVEVGSSGRICIFVAATQGDIEILEEGEFDMFSESMAYPVFCIRIAPACGQRHSKRARSILPVFTLPLRVKPLHDGSRSQDQLIIQDDEHMSIQSCRIFSFENICQSASRQDSHGVTRSSEVIIAESPGHLGIGGKIWDSSFVLIHFLSTSKELGGGRHFIERKRVVELGAGTGIVGLTCALTLGAEDVVLTDLEDVCELIQINIRLNNSQQYPSCCGVAAVPLVWTDPPPSSLPPRLLFGNASCGDTRSSTIDTLLLADVVYDPDLYVPLIATLSKLVPLDAERSFPIEVVLAFRYRNPDSHLFWSSLEKAGFSYSEFRFQFVDEEASGACQDVKIFQIYRT